MNGERILESTVGLFGEITVGESFQGSIRWLKINQEIEGQVFNSPGAADFSHLTQGSGPVSASPYLYGFIIAAWQFPSAQGLVLGLGAGAGITMLLALFPNLSLTVVEIDPEVIRLARRYFPLVSFYESQGRLRIIQSTAQNFLEHCRDMYAFMLLDVFSGNENNDKNLLLIHQALKICPYFMINIITSQAMLASVERALSFSNHSAEKLMWLPAVPAAASTKINWIMTNITVISTEIQQYKLFASLLPRESTRVANQYFSYILSQVAAACFYR